MASSYRFSSLVYELVSIIESGYGEGAIEWLDWDDPQHSLDLCRFGKTSVLRKIAMCLLTEEFRRDMSKNPDEWIETGKLDALQADFRFYRIKIQKFSAYCRSRGIREVDEEQDALEQWWDDNEEAFQTLYEFYCKEVEHLLFANRHFLLHFHLALAKFLASASKPGLAPSIPIPRVAIPRWVKRAAYFRDRGRCVFCRVDLSGIVDLDKEEHFDHIVALAVGGTNDPTNIQLSCRKCNLKKSKTAGTRYFYTDWWKDENANSG